MQIIINAGGTGTRLWPFSTSSTPKQFVPLIDEESFLRKTYNRLTSHFAKEDIWVNTNVRFFEQVVACLPADFPKNHILTEPQKKDTFAAIVAHAAVVSHFTTNTEPLVFIHADHLVQEADWEQFNTGLEKIAKSLLSKSFEIITAGIKPTFPNTQLGYIQVNKDLISDGFESPVQVTAFTEKPELATAIEFLDSGEYLWNLGYFSFTFESLLVILNRLYPELVEIVLSIQSDGSISVEHYEKLPKVAVDYAIAEKTESMGVLGMDISWEDVGSWEIAKQYLPALAENKNHIQIDGEDNKVKLTNTDRKVAFVGVSNLMLVESDEGILVINPKHSAAVKKVAEYFDK
jgi:mannose-1-phosphate guanylyltransferase